jgi:hypothetical protein
MGRACMKREDSSSFYYQSTDVCNQLHAPVSLTAKEDQRYPSDSTSLVSLRVGLCRESNCSRPDRDQITSAESFLFVLTESKMEIPSSGFCKCTIGASFLTRGTGRNYHHTWRHNYTASHRENGIFNSTPPESESVQFHRLRCCKTPACYATWQHRGFNTFLPLKNTK